MRNPRRLAAGLLLVGAILAAGTPAYLAHAAPHLRGYLQHAGLILGQIVPFLLCATVWLPWRAAGAGGAAVILAVLLLLASVMLYGPMLRAPASHGGDMIGLAFVAISAGMTAGVAVGSAVAALVLWLRHRARGREAAAGTVGRE